jgi:hypothetical protein
MGLGFSGEWIGGWEESAAAIFGGWGKRPDSVSSRDERRIQAGVALRRAHPLFTLNGSLESIEHCRPNS